MNRAERQWITQAAREEGVPWLWRWLQYRVATGPWWLWKAAFEIRWWIDQTAWLPIRWDFDKDRPKLRAAK